MDGCCECSGLLQTGLAGLKPHQVSVGGVGQAARNGRLNATADLEETLTGATTWEVGKGGRQEGQEQQQSEGVIAYKFAKMATKQQRNMIMPDHCSSRSAKIPEN